LVTGYPGVYSRQSLKVYINKEILTDCTGRLSVDPKRRKKTILIVEDDPVIATLIGFMLKDPGYLVAGSAATAEEAIDAAQKEKPDLILMDIHLKGQMDGIEAARTLWGDYHIPVIFITADAEDGTLQRALKISPLGFIRKPLDRKLFALTLKMAFYRYEEEQKRGDLKFRSAEVNFRDI
jgi:CheY-like chemotaxis protein